MKIGIVGSSGGSAFAAFHDILTEVGPSTYAFAAVTDRPCGLEDVCKARGIPLTRVDGPDNDAVSRNAANFLAEDAEPAFVLLYFLRLASAALYDRYPTFNIHPSLLPAFPGFNPVRRAFDAGVRFFGATLHQVDASVDNGPIVAQIVMPVAPSATLEQLEKYSYLHKVYCALLLVDMIERDLLSLEGGHVHLSGEFDPGCRSNPVIGEGPLLDRFRDLQRREAVDVIS